DTCGLAFHAVVHDQVVHHSRDFGIEREGHIGPVHIGNGVRDEGNGDDAQPALMCHAGMVSEPRARRYRNLTQRATAWRPPYGMDVKFLEVDHVFFLKSVRLGWFWLD